MASPTNDFLKTRASASAAIKLGQWHAGFSKMKKYAVDNKVPLLAVWSNGDNCGHCTHFEEICMNKKFVSWMKTSGVAFWFGYYGDKAAEDKFEGTGFQFARNGKLTTYPFVRLYWPAGKVDIYKSGDSWTGGIQEGALSKCVTKFLNALKAALKNYKPTTATTTTTTATTTTTTTAAKPPVLGCAADCCGGYDLTVDGKVATNLDKELAERVVTHYNRK